MKQKLDEYDLANNRFQESLNKKAAQIKEQTEIEKLVKQLQVMRVEIDIQRAAAIQIIQVVDGQQYEKLERRLHALFTYAGNWDNEQYKKYSIFSVKRGNIKTDFQQFTIQQPTILKRTRPRQKIVHGSFGPLMQRMFPLDKKTEETIRSNQTLNS